MLKFIALLLFLSTTAFAEYRPFDFDLKSQNPQEKGIFWGPFFSFLLPGVNQWYEGQYDQATFYSGVGLLGYAVAATSGIKKEDLEKRSEGGFDDNESDRFRQYALGGQIYQVAGGLSAYASFQSSVKYRKEKGEYAFIEKQESVDELLLAPFDFSYLKRPTTYWPLGGLLGLMILARESNLSKFSGSDAFYTGAYSYNAGTHEEAMFRGWLQPVLHENFNSPFWGNFTTSLIFAAAHGTNPTPWPQFMMGYYLGWLTQQNNYSLKEAIFIHVWWDVLAIGATYMDSDSKNDGMLYIPLYGASF
jgi:membrane protease YdiL (CAAX protease family)